VVLTSTLVLT